MGIRYDRNLGRATNGPLIFFSDPSSQEAVAEEIRGAIVSGLSFYCYRSPGSPMISFGSSERYVEGIEEGFVIGSFSHDFPLLSIPYRNSKKPTAITESYEMPESSTTYEEYSSEVEGIIRDLKGNRDSKVVAARVIVKEESLEPAKLFFELSSKFPESFIFCFSTPATGCWIGASPELLLEGKKQTLYTMALAGTRRKGEDTPWDDKNIKEQGIVTDYIRNVFRLYDKDVEEGELFNRVTGNLEHLCTPISVEWENIDKLTLEEIIRTLSPTPALCGNPKEFALEEIKKCEKFDRGCYGGFCGPFHSLNEFTFNVVLRCASFSQKKYCIYVGGGITYKSQVEAEWIETEMKMKNTFG